MLGEAEEEDKRDSGIGRRDGDLGIKLTATGRSILPYFPLTSESIRFQIATLSFDRDGSVFQFQNGASVMKTILKFP